MSRAYTSPVRDAISALLERDGPLTAAEITHQLGLDRTKVDSSIIHARQKYGTQFFRIAAYQRQVGVGGREAPMYGIGPEPDARRPRMDTKRDKQLIQERYRDKYRAVLRLRDRKRKGSRSNHFLDILGVRL